MGMPPSIIDPDGQEPAHRRPLERRITAQAWDDRALVATLAEENSCFLVRKILRQNNA